MRVTEDFKGFELFNGPIAGHTQTLTAIAGDVYELKHREGNWCVVVLNGDPTFTATPPPPSSGLLPIDVLMPVRVNGKFVRRNSDL